MNEKYKYRTVVIYTLFKTDLISVMCDVTYRNPLVQWDNSVSETEKQNIGKNLSSSQDSMVSYSIERKLTLFRHLDPQTIIRHKTYVISCGTKVTTYPNIIIYLNQAFRPTA